MKELTKEDVLNFLQELPVMIKIRGYLHCLNHEKRDKAIEQLKPLINDLMLAEKQVHKIFKDIRQED